MIGDRGDEVTGAERRQRIEELIRRLPVGFVATYGDLCPQAPRLAGQVLSRSEDESLPWFRVVRADGSLAKGARQRRLLRAEGVPFKGERVDMDVARIPGEALRDLA